MKTEYTKLSLLRNSGFSKQLHKDIIEQFAKSYSEGARYCHSRGFNVELCRWVVKIYSDNPYGFEMWLELEKQQVKH